MSRSNSIVLKTGEGDITLQMLPEAAPQTTAYISKLVQSRIYDTDGTTASFYRSDFVIQFGLYGTNKENPHGNMTVNETHTGQRISNTRGTAALAHFDVPDCGGTEVFINVTDNPHLDQAYGGFCVFARVDPNDADSFQTIDKIAAAVKAQGKEVIEKVFLKSIV